MQNSTSNNNQTTSDQPINQDQITIISITLVIIGIIVIILAILIKCIINKRRRLNKRNNRPPRNFQENGTELRRFDGPYQINTRIPGGGSNLINEISYLQLPQTYF